jgi:hypothetical protein
MNTRSVPDDRSRDHLRTAIADGKRVGIQPGAAALAALEHAVDEARDAGVLDPLGGQLVAAWEVDIALRRHASTLLEEARRARRAQRGKAGRNAQRAA